jgi:hypothetical protein
MNKKQLICMWIGIFVSISITFTFTTEPSDSLITVSKASHNWLDYIMLIARLLITLVVTAGMIYTLKDKKKNNSRTRGR